MFFAGKFLGNASKKINKALMRHMGGCVQKASSVVKRQAKEVAWLETPTHVSPTPRATSTRRELTNFQQQSPRPLTHPPSAAAAPICTPPLSRSPLILEVREGGREDGRLRRHLLPQSLASAVRHHLVIFPRLT